MSDVELETEADWLRVLELLNIPQRSIDLALNRAVHREALFVAGKIKEQFQSGKPARGAWQPHSDWTRRMRKAQGFKGTKLLVRTGDMFRSVGVTAQEPGAYFVGVHRTATSSTGAGSLANIGAIQEFGATFQIKVTRKMQRFLMAMLRKTARKRKARVKGQKRRKRKGGFESKGTFKLGATLTIKIPARPFMAPALEVWAKPEDVMERISERVVADLLKRFGGDGAGGSGGG